MEPPFEPFPAREPSHEVGDHASQPVACRRDDEACDGLAHGRKHGDIQGVGAERDYRCGEDVAEKQAEQAPVFEPEHQESSFSTAMNALWGTCTVPIWRMRFLPSFCFSSSASRAACAYGSHRLRSTSRSRPCAPASRSRGLLSWPLSPPESGCRTAVWG